MVDGIIKNSKIAVKEVSLELAWKDYLDNKSLYESSINECAQEVRKIHRNLSDDMVEENARYRTIKSKATDIEKRISYRIKTNFGLPKSFDLDDYSVKEIKDFLLFYENDLLRDESTLRNHRKVGKKNPNIRVASYSKINNLNHNFERYYDWVLINGNACLGRILEKNTIYECKERLDCLWKSAHININDIANYSKRNGELWINGLKYISSFCDYVMETYVLSCYECYAISRIIEDLLLSLIELVAKYNNTDFLYRLNKHFEVLNCRCHEVLQVKNKENSIEDIFENYAILFYLNSIRAEIEILYNILDELYELTLSDDRDIFFRKMPTADKKKMLREYLYGKLGERNEKSRIDGAINKAKKIGEKLNEVMLINIPIDNDIIVKSILDETLYYNRKIVISIGEKEKEYDTKKLAENLIQNRNLRGEEIIILNEKIKRGIDCNIYGKEHYLLKNQLYRMVYDVEKKILDKRNTEKYFVKNIIYYWQEVLYLLIGIAVRNL